MNGEYGAPFSAVDVILLPGIVFIAAVLMRFLAWNMQRMHKNPRWMKLSAYIVTLVGVWIAVKYLYTMYNPDTGFLYMRTLKPMMKVLLAHYIVIALPFLTLIGFVLWDRAEKKLGRPLSI